MSFSERIQQLCPLVSNEQATEFRESLMDATARLEAEPQLMAISLKTLEQEVKDQGYAWDSIVVVLQQVAKANSACDEPERLMEAWQTSMASEGSIAGFAAVLKDRFPKTYSMLVELVEMARDEQSSLSGVAGGTHIGAGIKNAGAATGNALAKPWKSHPNTTGHKVEKFVGEGVELLAALKVGQLAFKAIRNAYTKAPPKPLEEHHFNQVSLDTRNSGAESIQLPKQLSHLSEGEVSRLVEGVKFAVLDKDPNLVGKVAEKLNMQPVSMDELSAFEQDLLSQHGQYIIKRNIQSYVTSYIRANPASDMFPNLGNETHAGKVNQAIMAKAEQLGPRNNKGTEFGAKDEKEANMIMSRLYNTNDSSFTLPNGLTRGELTPADREMIAVRQMSRYIQSSPDNVKVLIDSNAGGNRPPDNMMGKIRAKVMGEIKGHFLSQLGQDIIKDPKARNINIADFRGDFEYDSSGKLTVKRSSSANPLVDEKPSWANALVDDDNQLSNAYRLPRNNDSSLDNNPDFKRNLANYSNALSSDISIVDGEASDVNLSNVSRVVERDMSNAAIDPANLKKSSPTSSPMSTVVADVSGNIDEPIEDPFGNEVDSIAEAGQKEVAADMNAAAKQVGSDAQAAVNDEVSAASDALEDI